MNTTRRQPTREPDAPRMKYQRLPSGPENPATLRKRISHLERELAIIRRYTHKLEREAGKPPTKYFNMPKYGKLKYRPVLLGFSPTAGCRSGLPFDDEHGDYLAEVLGLTGYQHMLVNFKVRNIFTHPAEDLLHADRGPEKMRWAMNRHATDGLFDGRVVIVAGRDAQRAAALDVPAGHVGPLARSSEYFSRSALVIAMPDIGHPRQWKREARRSMWDMALLAMTASRMPCADPVSAAMLLASSGSAMTEPTWTDFSPLAYPAHAENGRDMWAAMIATGLAAPPNLTRDAWVRWNGAFVLHTTGGHAVLIVEADRKTAEVVVYERGAGLANVPVLASQGKPGDLRREAEQYMFGRGWDYPFRALDQRLEQIRKGTP